MPQIHTAFQREQMAFRVSSIKIFTANELGQRILPQLKTSKRAKKLQAEWGFSPAH
jgi:hypothetical protein